jgi:hypothetical protein
LLDDVEAAFVAEVDVDQRHIWPQLRKARKRLGTARRHADDNDAVALEQSAHGVDEIPAVIND